MTKSVTSTRRRNPLTGEYVLVSPIRLSRPWSQATDKIEETALPGYEETCNLCPQNTRANGEVNPAYQQTFLFENDFPSFVKSAHKKLSFSENDLISEAEEIGWCEVLCYSPQHNLNFVNLPVEEIKEVILVLKKQYLELSKNKNIKHIQIFETRGKEVGNSAPHPHCQIWSQSSIPSLPQKIYKNQNQYFKKRGRKLLRDYVGYEIAKKERIVCEVGNFVLLVPFWAEWPYETYILPKVDLSSMGELSDLQCSDLAQLLSMTAKLYANLFKRPMNGAPYMMSISQKPTLRSKYNSLQLFIRFISPLLNPTRQKYQAGYEKSAEPQRDSTPEQAAAELRSALIINRKELSLSGINHCILDLSVTGNSNHPWR